MVEYRCFQGLDMGEITWCMNRVFSDYPVSIRLTRQPDSYGGFAWV